jgi:hypothetical protein
MMKRMITSLLAMAVLAAVAMFAPTAKHRFTALPLVHAQSGCSNATLSGNYGLTFQGFDIVRGGMNSVPFAGAGVLGFDGGGNVSISLTTALNGQISPVDTSAGTYTVNSDCTGALSLTTGNAAGETLYLVIVSSGREVLGMSTLNTQTLTFDAKKQ